MEAQICCFLYHFFKGWRPKTPFSVFEPILYRYICTITLVFTSEILCIAKGHMGIFCRLAVFFLRKEWRNTAFSSLLSFRPSVASCCCHCSCFQQQQLLQAAIAMDDATGIMLHSLKRPILHSACSGDRTVKRHEPYKYMRLL